MSDSLFTTHRFVIPIKKFGEPIYLIPFGDIHRHAPMCDVKRWKEFLDWAKGKKNAYFLGMGDYDDFLSGSERVGMEHAGLHESSKETIDSMSKRFVDELCDEMKFMKNRIVGMLEGNHYMNFRTGITSTQMMCEKLETTYLGYSSFIRLAFKYNDHHSYVTTDIWAHHGKGGGGRLVGGSVNSVQHMGEIADAQIYLSGHDHKKWVAMKTKLYLASGWGERLNMRHKKILLGRTGSFLRGYVPGEDSYVAKACMTPTDLGVIKIELTPKRVVDKKLRTDVMEVDIHASV